MRPRIRTIKPDVWQSEQIGQVSREARLLFVGLITYADDEGRFRAHPALLRAHVFPYDEISTREVAGWLSELQAAGLVLAYRARGSAWGCLPSFAKHQVINKKSPSECPAPSEAEPEDILPKLTDSGSSPVVLPEDSRSSPVVLPEDSGSSPVVLPEDSRTEWKGIGIGKEGNGKEEERNGDEASLLASSFATSANSQPEDTPQKLQPCETLMSSRPAPSSQETFALAGASPPSIAVGDFPCVGKGAKTWHLTEQHLAELQEAYPGIDVLGEAKRARQWCRDNRPQRKTERGMPKFIGGWMARAQNRGSQRPRRGLNGFEAGGSIADTIRRDLADWAKSDPSVQGEESEAEADWRAA